jgi:hypothetical protein
MPTRAEDRGGGKQLCDIHLSFYVLLGFRETPNLEADMYLDCSGGNVLNWGGAKEIVL